MVICVSCKLEVDIELANRRGEGKYRCKECQKKFYTLGKEKYIKKAVKYNRESRRHYRALAVEKLGGKCCQCGNNDFRVLEIDHVNGDGYLLRKEGKRHGAQKYKFFREIVEGKTDNAQLLCANCHKIKTYENGENIWKENRETEE